MKDFFPESLGQEQGCTLYTGRMVGKGMHKFCETNLWPSKGISTETLQEFSKGWLIQLYIIANWIRGWE